MSATEKECEALVRRIQNSFSGLAIDAMVTEVDRGFGVWIISQESLKVFGPAQIEKILPPNEWNVTYRESEARGITFLLLKGARQK